jgi:hypothetical protein
MTTTTAVTAADVRKGDFIHRVEKNPRSRVFEVPVDAKVLDAYPHPDYPGTIHIVLEPQAPATASSLNLDAGRTVHVVR